MRRCSASRSTPTRRRGGGGPSRCWPTGGCVDLLRRLPGLASGPGPELVGRGWLNTGGQVLTSLADFGGRVVVLDFWTFCCVNCLHVLDELRPVEAKYPDALTIVGVHSPKFEHEADPDALAAAVERYAVHHPVLDDPELVTWRAYTARAWPTLVVVDPEGYVVASMSGGGARPGSRLARRRAHRGARGQGHAPAGRRPVRPAASRLTALRFPGKAVALADGSFVVSDTANHQVVHLEADLETERARWGGPASFNEPQGVLLAARAADRLGFDLLVADSVNHQVKGIRFSDNDPRRRPGPADSCASAPAAGPALEQDLSTPGTWRGWATASSSPWPAPTSSGPGPRRRPGEGTVEVLGGTTNEGLRDGAAREAWFAQPSGWPPPPTARAVGRRLRDVGPARSPWSTTARSVETHVGTGLFDFGHRDGPADQALLQHPLGVTELPDGSVAVSDTYNGAIRRYDPARNRGVDPGPRARRAERRGRRARSTIPARPASSSSSPAAHRLARVALPEDAQRVDGPARRTQRPRPIAAPGLSTSR